MTALRGWPPTVSAAMMTAMDLQTTLAYDAPPEDVLAMMLEPAFWDRVAERTGAVTSETSVEGTATGTCVRTEEVQETAGVPAFARKIAGDRTRVVKHLTWHGLDCSVEIESPGKPTSICGSAALVPDGSGTRLTYDLDVRATVPLIGGKIEKLVVQLTTEGFEREHAAGVAWLRGELR